MLTRNGQIGIKIEAVEGTEEALVAVDYSGNRKEQTHRDTRNSYKRDLQRGTLTQQPELTSMFKGNINYTEEMVGGGAAAAAPWHTTQQALGFKKTAIKKYIIGALTAGTPYVGISIGNNAVQANATKTGVIVGIVGGKTYIYQTSGAAFANADIIYGYDGAAPQLQETLGDNGAAGGYTFSPQTETDAAVPPSITTDRRLGGQRHTRIGTRGTGGLTLKMGEPLLLHAEMHGVPVYADAALRSPRLAGYVAAVPVYAVPPKVAQGIPFTLRTDSLTSYTPVMTEVNLQFGNTLAPRGTITNVDLQSSGYLPTRITGRDITATIDPEHILPASGFDFIGALNTGATFLMVAQIGSVTDANGLVTIIGQQVMLKGDYEPGDRDGVATSPVTLGFYGNVDDELLISHLF